MITFAAVSQTKQLQRTEDNLRELIMKRLFDAEISLPKSVNPFLSPWQNAHFVDNTRISGATR
jgi:hypothetical protein